MDINKKNDQLGVIVIVVLQYLVNFPQIDLLLWFMGNTTIIPKIYECICLK